ncbi:hypothetical protein [uncultured Corynebacterium sp.]|uniref:hypothetical protein n=1 Tax=uncultured Corynebacterium sp. TaxID=159447 RepID=UPI0025E3DA8E|nr:hypothetical protein [uncultured Corynebacterium sp.]
MAMRRIRYPRALGFGAGLLALSLVVFSAAGAVWGLTRPKLTGRAVGDGSGGYVIDAVDDIQFTSFAWFVIITAIGGFLIGLVAYVRGAGTRSLAMLLWSGIVALAGAYAFWVFGSATAPGLPDNPGDVVQWVPAFNPGVGLTAAPFIAVFTYWSTAFISADEDWERGKVAASEAGTA